LGTQEEPSQEKTSKERNPVLALGNATQAALSGHRSSFSSSIASLLSTLCTCMRFLLDLDFFFDIRKLRGKELQGFLLPWACIQLGGLRHLPPTPALRDGNAGNFCKGRKALQLGHLTCICPFKLHRNVRRMSEKRGKAGSWSHFSICVHFWCFFSLPSSCGQHRL
jgi:hypothetical protein